MFWKVYDWSFKHFPDKKFGEWFGYLHRDGSVSQEAKGNMYKGPFHLPRMLLLCHQLCNELAAETVAQHPQPQPTPTVAPANESPAAPAPTPAQSDSPSKKRPREEPVAQGL